MVQPQALREIMVANPTVALMGNQGQEWKHTKHGRGGRQPEAF